MRKLKKTNLCSPIDFFDMAVNCKKGTFFSQWAVSIRALLNTEFDLYDAELSNDSLEKLVANSNLCSHKEMFSQLYAYDRSCIEKLRSNIARLNGNTYKCPYCSIGPVGSMDHYLPQEKFTYFSVHPYNLIPCCKDCNSQKNSKWIDATSNRRIFLNSYIDDIESIQFLFVKINMSKDVPNFTYYVDNRNGLSTRMFDIVQSHFSELELNDRYGEQSYEVLTTLASEIRHKRKNAFDCDIIKEKKEEIIEKQKIFGYNNWKLVLEYECIDNLTVYNYLTQMQL